MDSSAVSSCITVQRLATSLCATQCQEQRVHCFVRSLQECVAALQNFYFLNFLNFFAFTFQWHYAQGRQQLSLYSCPMCWLSLLSFYFAQDDRHIAADQAVSSYQLTKCSSAYTEWTTCLLRMRIKRQKKIKQNFWKTQPFQMHRVISKASILLETGA